MDPSDIVAQFMTLGITQAGTLTSHMYWAQRCHIDFFGQPLFTVFDAEPVTAWSDIQAMVLSFKFSSIKPKILCPITQDFLKIVCDVLATQTIETISNAIRAKVDKHDEALKQQAEQALKNIPACWFEE